MKSTIKTILKSHLFHLFAFAGLSLPLAVSSLAHHSQSEFDSKLTLRIEGTISKLEWRSPHARLYVDSIDENGEVVNWNFELPSPNTLMRRGWKRNSMVPGDRVVVTGYRARNYPHIGIGRAITDGDGNPMFSGLAN